MKLRRTHLQLVLVLIFFSAFIGCNSVAPDMTEMMDDDMTDPSDTTTTTMFDPAPNFSLNSVSGGLVTLADFKEKPLVIFFFGNTCPLCISSGPKIQSTITEAFSSDDMAIIGIDTWDGNASSVTNFRSRTGVTFDLLLKGSSVASDYSTTYDRLLVINGKGEIVFKGTTGAGNDVDKVATLLTDLLQ